MTLITRNTRAKIAILIDPDKNWSFAHLERLCEKIEFSKADYIFIGGSLVEEWKFQSCLESLNELIAIPKVIFPGNNQQISNSADALLLLSLISGRNPEYLIGQHVSAAKKIKNLGIEVIPTGYILIDGESPTAVSYVSQTTPIPRDATNLATNTAIAGEILGLKSIFIDAGSGAKSSIPLSLIGEIRKEITVPLIVGGGIKTYKEIEQISAAGADIIVIGNKIEEDIEFLLEIETYCKTKA